MNSKLKTTIGLVQLYNSVIVLQVISSKNNPKSKLSIHTSIKLIILHNVKGGGGRFKQARNPLNIHVWRAGAFDEACRMFRMLEGPTG